MHFDHAPSLDQIVGGLQDLSRADLLATDDNAPMLVINGAEDCFVPPSDTQIFEGRPNTEVHLLEHTGHCAISRLPEVLPMINTWLTAQFTPSAAAR